MKIFLPLDLLFAPRCSAVARVADGLCHVAFILSYNWYALTSHNVFIIRNSGYTVFVSRIALDIWNKLYFCELLLPSQCSWIKWILRIRIAFIYDVINYYVKIFSAYGLILIWPDLDVGCRPMRTCQVLLIWNYIKIHCHTNDTFDGDYVHVSNIISEEIFLNVCFKELYYSDLYKSVIM